MNQVKPTLQRFFQLIAEGKLSDARSYADRDHAATVDRLKKEYEEAASDLSLMRTVLSTVATPTQIQPQSQEAPATVAARAIAATLANGPAVLGGEGLDGDTRSKIIAIAQAIATSNNGIVTTGDVLSEMERLDVKINS